MDTTVDITTINDLKELKALAYDQLTLRAQVDANLQIIDQRMKHLLARDSKIEQAKNKLKNKNA